MQKNKHEAAALTISNAFQKHIKYGYLDRAPLTMMTRYYLNNIFMGYDRPEGRDASISAVLWILLLCSSGFINSWLALAVIAFFAFRIIQFRYLFEKEIKNHPEELKTAATYWCDYYHDRKEEMSTVLLFVDNEFLKGHQLRSAVSILLSDINEKRKSNLTKNTKEKYNAMFCPDSPSTNLKKNT